MKLTDNIKKNISPRSINEIEKFSNYQIKEIEKCGFTVKLIDTTNITQDITNVLSLFKTLQFNNITVILYSQNVPFTNNGLCALNDKHINGSLVIAPINNPFVLLHELCHVLDYSLGTNDLKQGISFQKPYNDLKNGIATKYRHSLTKNEKIENLANTTYSHKKEAFQKYCRYYGSTKESFAELLSKYINETRQLNLKRYYNGNSGPFFEFTDTFYQQHYAEISKYFDPIVTHHIATI